MKKTTAWTPQKKQRVFDMLDQGMTGRQVAEVMGVTRNAIMGLKYREYKGEAVPEPPKRTLLEEEKKLLEAGTHWHRKCLKCRNERVLEKNTFLCKECKESPIFSGIV